MAIAPWGRALAATACVVASLAQAQGTEAAAAAIEPAQWFPDLEWRLSAAVQGDLLLNSDLPEDRQKSAELRRARIAGQLVLDDGIRLSASGDFSDGARLRDLFVEIRKTEQYFAVGRFPEPFGLAAQESSRAGLMMERPQPTAIVPGYGLGGAVNLGGTNWGFTLGVFAAQGELSDEDALKGYRKEDAISARYTATRWRTAERLVHLGFSLSNRRPKAEVLRFVAIPESVLLKGLQLSSGVIPVNSEGDDSYLLGGFEFAYAQGPLLLQSELMLAALPDEFFFDPNQTPTTPQDFMASSDYKGGYVEAGWVLTGERRPYSTRRGVFGPVTPVGPWDEGSFGAWEVAARMSFTDFSRHPFDEFDESGVSTGGRGQITSLGLNWYPTALARVSLNGLRIEKKREEERETASAVQMRVYLQFDLPRDRDR